LLVGVTSAEWFWESYALSHRMESVLRIARSRRGSATFSIADDEGILTQREKLRQLP
jgi:hypothetical protein